VDLREVDNTHIFSNADVLTSCERRSAGGCAMGKRVFLLLVIAILSIVGMGSMTSASARGGGSRGGFIASRSAAHTSVLFSQRRFFAQGGFFSTGGFLAAGAFTGVGRFQNGFSRRNGQFGNYGWLGDWPYAWWPMDTTSPQVVTEAPSRPEVIVISGANDGRGRAVAEDDYSYVAGCHAIPNGYHCDPPRQQAQSR
jgi:hypothetical protein